MGRSLGSMKSESEGQQGLVFQGCTKAQKNMEKYYENISEVKLCHGSSLDPPCPSEALPPPLTVQPISDVFGLTSDPTGSSVSF